MTEHVKQRLYLNHDRRKRAWSVSFRESGIYPVGVREDMARGMVAEVALEGARVRNDFDRVSIYQRPICNATFDTATGRWKDFVYQGEEGFTFAPTEQRREVLYRCRPFWYYLEMGDTTGPVFVSVSDRPLEGYRLAPMFKNGKDFVYRPCFEMAMGEDGVPHSRAGMTALENAPLAVMQAARSFDSAAHTETMAEWFSDYLLLLVEFGTRDLRSVMTGNSGGDQTIYRVKPEYATEANPTGLHVRSCGYYVGQEITVLAKARVYKDENMDDWSPAETDSVISNTVIKSITPNIDDPYPSYTQYAYRIEFEDETVYDRLEEYSNPHCIGKVCKTGEALPLVSVASSGAAIALQGGPCVWRGKENPWGNVSSLICDMMFLAPERFVLETYALDDVQKYDGTLNEHYRKCDMTAKYWKGYGYINTFVVDPVKSHVIAPKQVQTAYAWKNTAARYYMSDESAANLKHLRVGGDFRDANATQHATYEVVENEHFVNQFGGRLIVEERS